jgi:hypothetical protein
MRRPVRHGRATKLQAVEHAAFRGTTDLGRGSAFDADLRPDKAPPLSEGLPIIERRVLRPLAAKGAGELVPVLEVVGAVVNRQCLAVPAHPDIGRVTVQAVAGQQVAVVHGDALALMDGGRISVVDLGVILVVEPHLAPIGAVQPHREAGAATVWLDPLHGPERPIFHAHGPLVS